MSSDKFQNSYKDETANIICEFADTASRGVDTQNYLEEKQKKQEPEKVFYCTLFQKLGEKNPPNTDNVNKFTCTLEVENEKKGLFKVSRLATKITDIKIEKTEEEIKKELEEKKKQEEAERKKEEARKKTKPLLLKSSLIGGGFVALGLVSAYVLTRKKQTKPVLNSFNVKNKSNTHTTTTHLFPAEQPSKK